MEEKKFKVGQRRVNIKELRNWVKKKIEPSNMNEGLKNYWRKYLEESEKSLKPKTQEELEQEEKEQEEKVRQEREHQKEVEKDLARLGNLALAEDEDLDDTELDGRPTPSYEEVIKKCQKKVDKARKLRRILNKKIKKYNKKIEDLRYKRLHF